MVRRAVMAVGRREMDSVFLPPYALALDPLLAVDPRLSGG